MRYDWFDMGLLRRLSFLLLCAGGVAAAQPAPDAPPPPPPSADPTPPPEPPPAPVAPASVAPVPPPVTAPPPAEPPKSDKEQEAAAPYEPSSVSVGGYLQPQFRMRQNAPGAQFDQDGFRFARARLIAVAQTRAGNLDLSATLEAEMQPQFALADAYATIARTFPTGKKGDLPGRIAIDGGQMRVPISRQNMLSDSRLSFVDKAQLATILSQTDPKIERDLGVRITAAPPKLPVKVFAGVFNGEGKNQVENINESYLYAARVEISPWGRDNALAESAFGGTQLTLGLSYAHDKLTSIGNGHELVTYLGADVFASYKGLSASYEYLQAKHDYESPVDGAMLPPTYLANGWVAQAAYLLPVKLPPFKQSRIEIAARVEEIDRNDTVPIVAIGDPAQSVREYTGVLSYYLRMHSLKAQLAVSHFQEIEDRTAAGTDAAYDNDQLLLQVTYRME